MIRAITTVIALFSALFMSACQENDISGIYSYSFESGIYSHDGGECAAPYKTDVNGKMCYEPIEVSNQLGLMQTDDGDLQFAVHLTFFNWHTCTLDGVTQKQGNAWVYRDDEFGDGCMLSITQDGDEIVLTTDEVSHCRDYCGARGSINNARFAMSSKINGAPTPQDIACITSYEDACQE